MALYIFLMAAGISLYASSNPDGLEWVAETLTHEGEWGAEEENPMINAPMPDYSVPWIKNETLGGSLAGLFGVLLMFLLVYGIGNVLKGRDDANQTEK